MHLLIVVRQTAETLSPESLAAIAGFVLALAFAYFPKLNVWYAALTSEAKSGIMLGLMALVAGLTFAQACTAFHLLPWVTTCDQPGAETLIRTFVYAVGLNQGAYKLLPEAAAVKAARAARPA